VKFSVSVTSATARQALVDVEVYVLAGNKVFQQVFDGQTFTAGQPRVLSASWPVPRGQRGGVYKLKVGVFSVGWGTLFHWNDSAASFIIR
jgi:hypothetical protein